MIVAVTHRKPQPHLFFNSPMSVPWHQLSLEEVWEHLETNPHKGLLEEEAARRQAAQGPNRIAEEERRPLYEKILAQFKSPLVYVLLIAGAFTVVLGEYLDAIVIAVALLINVIVGVLQEERASRAFEKLRASQHTRAIALRGGKKHNIPAEDLVTGDIVLLEAGWKVPADVRLIEAKELRVNEAALTGEWLAVRKEPGVLPTDTPLAERTNMLYMGTLVTEGSGKGVVVACGDATEVGTIAAALGSVEEGATPLQRKLQGLAHFLAYGIAAIAAGIFALGVVRGEPLEEMLLIGVAIAVAAIPSGLPAAVTVVLAIGMEEILKRGGLVRNLLAAETLGSTTIILTDKTGTLTQAKMRVKEIHTESSLGTRDESADDWTRDDRFALECAVMVADAFVEEQEDAPRKLTVHGRPVEKAVVLAGLEAGISKAHLSEVWTRLDYLPFSSAQRFAAALYARAGKHERRLFVAGAPELLLEGATHFYRDGRKMKMAPEVRAAFLAQCDARSRDGLRLIGVGYREVAWHAFPDDKEEIPRDLVFAGFIALQDPLREDVADSIREVQEAGARVIMVTGDNIETARAVARRVGILAGANIAVRGEELARYDDDALYELLLRQVAVIARATPRQKLRMVEVLRARGEAVAMTGDGVNDAPALRAASIGVAVGSGTEVAKEASDLVLLNDSFTIITAAIEEGRRIIDNLRKIIAYLLSTSFSEVFVIAAALMVGVPLPLLPSQILWANIVQEGFMSFAFAFEKKDPHAMQRDPRSSSSQRMITPELRTLILAVSTVTGVFLVALYFSLRALSLPLGEIRTMMFVALSLGVIFFSFSLKSLDTPLWRINPFDNRYLLGALLVSISLLVAAVSLPALRTLLSLTPLTSFDLAILAGVGLFNLATIEIAKYLLFVRRYRKRPGLVE